MQVKGVQKELSTPLLEMQIYMISVLKYFNDISLHLIAPRKVKKFMN